MNLRLAVLGLVLMLTGCTSANTPSQAGATGRPTLPPAASPSPQPTAAPATIVSRSRTPIATGLPGRQGVVAYSVCPGGHSCRIWVVDDDGTGAHELLPDEPGEQRPLAWSADGSKLYYYFAWTGLSPTDGRTGLAVTDAIGSAPRVLFDAGNPTSGNGEWCPEPFADDNCGWYPDGGMAISPDGTRLAYPITEGDISTIVVLDVASGQIIRLESTRTLNPRTLPEGEVRGGDGTEPCTAAHGGYNGVPQWSPDGTRLVFTRTGCHYAIFTIGADGSDLREVVPFQWGPGVVPRWSPDGSRILFDSPTDYSTDGPHAGRVDIATVRPDGTGFQALTSDGVSVWPYWTQDGRIVFVRWTGPAGGPGYLWIMDADDGNATRLDATVPALTGAGCVVCPYPIDADPDPGQPNRYVGEDGLNLRLWQPRKEDQS